MTEVIIRKHFSIKGSDLKRAFREDREFKADRLNAAGNVLNFMACVDGWVMARRPNDTPLVLTEGQWRAFETYDGQSPRE